MNPHDFVRRPGSDSIGMIVALAAHVFDTPFDGKAPIGLLVAWIGGEPSWEEPADLEVIDSLAGLVAQGMVAMWDHGAQSMLNRK